MVGGGFFSRSLWIASAVMRMIAGLRPMAAYSRMPTVDWMTVSSAKAGLPATLKTAAMTKTQASTRAAVTR